MGEVKIVIPAAGGGQRFKDAGYKEPKPMINVCGRPMIDRVLDNLRPSPSTDYMVITRSEDKVGIFSEHNLTLNKPTDGAVDTILKAEGWVGNSPIILANCDQLVDFNVLDFIDKSAEDGSFVTFHSNKPHHSYVGVERDRGIVNRIVEKEVISQKAVTGVYFFKNGRKFMRAARAVMQLGIKVKGEFYTSSVIAAMIEDGDEFNTYDAPTAILGTPEELQLFENAVKVANATVR